MWLGHRALVWGEVGDETGVAIQGQLVQYFEFQMKDFMLNSVGDNVLF